MALTAQTSMKNQSVTMTQFQGVFGHTVQSVITTVSTPRSCQQTLRLPRRCFNEGKSPSSGLTVNFLPLAPGGPYTTGKPLLSWDDRSLRLNVEMLAK